MVAARVSFTSLWILTVINWLPTPGRASLVKYEIDEASSVLSIVAAEFAADATIASGTRFATNLGIVPQGPGSLTVHLSGTLQADLEGTTLTFSAGSRINALPNANAPTGGYLPKVAGSPGVEDNFGGFAAFVSPANHLGTLALRDAAADIVSGTLSPGQPADHLEFGLTAGILEYSIPILKDIGLTSEEFLDVPDLVEPAQNQSPELVIGSIDDTLHIPFHLDFVFDLVGEDNGDSRLVLEGSLVATRFATSRPGDFDGNGRTDGDDFLIWQANFATAGPHDLATGDADGDADVDGDDFLIWQVNFATAAQDEPVSRMTGTSSPETREIPEPAALFAVLILTACGCLKYRTCLKEGAA